MMIQPPASRAQEWVWFVHPALKCWASLRRPRRGLNFKTSQGSPGPQLHVSRRMLVYYVQSKTDRLTSLNDHSAEHRPILPVANRARIARRDRVWAALCALEGSAEDSRQAFHPDGHRLRGHGGPADDPSASAILRTDTRWFRIDVLGMHFGIDHHGLHRCFLYVRTIAERADVGPVF